MSIADNLSREDAGFIVLMGMTGSGKSTFISRLTGRRARVGVGHSLASSQSSMAPEPPTTIRSRYLTCLTGTVDTACYTAQYDERRLVRLIDTPGFDDTTRSDAEILQTILAQLATLCHDNQRFLGIVFLHRITDVRLAGSAIKTFNILQKLCGPGNYHKIVLGTTMWADARFRQGALEAAVGREMQLRRHWEEMFQGQSEILRHEDTKESARRIVSVLINNQNVGNKLQIERELLVDKLRIEETEAGRYVQRDLLLARERLHREIAELQKMVDDMAGQKNGQAARGVSSEEEAAGSEITESPDESSSPGVPGRQHPTEEADLWTTENSHRRRLGDQDNPAPGLPEIVGRWTRWVSSLLGRTPTNGNTPSRRNSNTVGTVADSYASSKSAASSATDLAYF